MYVMAVPSVERFSATSDLELKLVVPRLGGIGSVLTSVPVGVSWRRKTGEVMPKLPSTRSLLNTLFVLVVEAYAPLSVAFAALHCVVAVAGHTGGNGCPTASVAALPL
jgi:hypothetical protein